MNRRLARMGGGALIVLATALPAQQRAAADSPTDCTRKDPGGFCIEWAVPTPGTPAQPGGSGDTPRQVVCYWYNIPTVNDPTVYADFGLEQPAPGVTIVWQAYRCSDGSGAPTVRWVVDVTPGDVAQTIRGHLAQTLPEPAVAASPAIGVASIVGVPVFVAVTNWTGVVTESGCAGGICVTVTATPKLTFIPGETNAVTVTCTAGGTRFDPAQLPKTQAATAGACAYTYRRRTGVEGRPQAWPGSVAVGWAITWTANTGATGTLAPINPTTALPRSVQEVQTVVVGGETP
jgi:hypothetical protein